ncbi:Nodulin-25 [Medicago truncatula]|uniref:Nodulin-25 n=1 Tax=Medicago truncatula TaxID=3880 RepID=Q9LDI8_MEDTR|nr:nodulin-25 isoform X1 [Medicago truncatula]AES70452.1 nodulin-25 protein [Medicago truncatula]RHN67222.1 Nodulin-25 [Medicago truncatula]CAB91091.1 nodulin 25 [Medicago truncatula]CAB91092.1 nodulin 25 [Medicago truncatula]
MVYSNSYMFLGLGVFVLLSSHVLAYNMRADPSIHDSTLDDQMSNDFVKTASIAECPPGPHTYPELSDSTLNDQKSIDYVKDASTVDHNCPPGPHTHPELSVWLQEEQNSIDKVKVLITDEALDNQKGLEYKDTRHNDGSIEISTRTEKDNFIPSDGPIEISSRTEKKNVIPSDESIEISTGTEKENFIPSVGPIDLTTGAQKKNFIPSVDWRTFHAKYPWIKKNDPNTVTGSRKLLNDIASE